MRRIAVLITSLVITLMSLMPTLANGTAPLPATPPLQLRYSTADDKTRVVLDLPAEATIHEQITGAAVAVTIATPLPEPNPIVPVTLTDSAVSGIAVSANEMKEMVLTVTLAKPRKATVFTLKAQDGKPFRVVVDVLKNFSTQEQKALTPAITYTRLEQQADDRYITAHIIEADAQDAHIHLAMAAAIPGGETVASMVTRNGAVCGVNGGYFLAGTRPVGLLKVAGNLVSVPLWNRTAMAFPAHGAPVFGNPSGGWQVTLPDGSTRMAADWLDASLQTPAPTLRVIPGATIGQAPANPTGMTAIIHDGTVTARPTTTTPLNPGDYALHLTGDDAVALDAMLTVGTAVTITPVMTTPDWSLYADAAGAGPRLLLDGTVAISGMEEHFKPDILTGRHARTGIGVTENGTVVLVVVEAPQPWGGGATLTELAELLKAHGVHDAMNLDGGGSSSLGVGGDTVNYPAKSWVRPVACGVLIYDDRQPKPIVIKN